MQHSSTPCSPNDAASTANCSPNAPSSVCRHCDWHDTIFNCASYILYVCRFHPFYYYHSCYVVAQLLVAAATTACRFGFSVGTTSPPAVLLTVCPLPSLSLLQFAFWHNLVLISIPVILVAASAHNM